MPHTVQNRVEIVQSSLSIFAQKYLRKCEDTYLILQNKYLHIYEDSFGAKMPRDDYTQNILKHFARLWLKAKELTKFDILPLSVTIGSTYQFLIALQLFWTTCFRLYIHTYIYTAGGHAKPLSLICSLVFNSHDDGRRNVSQKLPNSYITWVHILRE